MSRTCLFLAALACSLALTSHVAAKRTHAPLMQSHAFGSAGRSGRTNEGMLTLRSAGTQRVHIRGGKFRMGSTVPEVAMANGMCRREPDTSRCTAGRFANELPDHEVVLDDFWIDRMEVSNAAYRRCADAGKCRRPTSSAQTRRLAVDNHPVTMVRWFDARGFCAWVGGRLPTEAEWERAARGWSGRRFPWGHNYNPSIANHGRVALVRLDDSDGFAELAAVGSFPQGRTLEGVYDMAGNVEEWVADWYSNRYPESGQNNPKGPAIGDFKTVRGGSYVDGGAWLRGAARARALPSLAQPWRGFRCAYDER